MTDRESRIRALAPHVLMHLMWRHGASFPVSKEACEIALKDAASAIDAIDALPVPGEAKVCRDCGGTGVWTGHPDYFNKCVRCNGTGKAER